jgi:hypothetical protein
MTSKYGPQRSRAGGSATTTYTAAAPLLKRKRPPAGELPEAALAAVRSRDATRRGSSEKPYSTKALLNQATDNRHEQLTIDDNWAHD